MPKKKILLLSDDLRMSSGVGTMSKEFVLGSCHHFDWVQVGGAIKMMTRSNTNSFDIVPTPEDILKSSESNKIFFLGI
jgi:hypothetical protein